MSADDLVSPLRAVCVFDPAIDLDVTPINVYAETRAADLVVIKPGAHAWWAVLRPLSVGDFMACDSAPSPSVKLLQAFRLACERIENFSGPGIALEPTKMHRLPDGRERAIWGDDGLQRIADQLGIAYIYELGSVAFERAVSGNALSGSVFFTLPPSSTLALGRMMRLHAVQRLQTDGTPFSAKSAASSTATPAAT